MKVEQQVFIENTLFTIGVFLLGFGIGSSILMLATDTLYTDTTLMLLSLVTISSSVLCFILGFWSINSRFTKLLHEAKHRRLRKELNKRLNEQ